MAKYKITQDHNACIGCGACVAACSNNWAIGEDNKASPKKTTIEEEEYQCNKSAADSCPVQCIKIEKEE